MNRRVATVVLGAGTGAAILGSWELLDRTGVIDFDSTAPPSDVASAWWQLVTDGRLPDVTAHTLRAFAFAWLIAVVGGAVLGLVLGLSPPANRLLGMSVTFFRFVPPPALVPVVVLLWGFSLRSEVSLAAYAAMWPITINMASGVQQTDPRLLEVGSTLGLGTLRRVWKLVLPSALPMLITGVRIGSTICLVAIVTVEMIGVPRGLGSEIVRSSQSLRPADAFAYVVWTGVLGAILAAGIRATERGLLRWRPPGSV